MSSGRQSAMTRIRLDDHVADREQLRPRNPSRTGQQNTIDQSPAGVLRDLLHADAMDQGIGVTMHQPPFGSFAAEPEGDPMRLAAFTSDGVFEKP